MSIGGNKMKFLLSAFVVTVFASNSSAYYQSQQGRWMTRDHIGERGGLNMYAHTRNTPVNLIDTFGNAYGNPVSGLTGPVGPAYPYDPNPWDPLPPLPPAPGPGDQINPLGCRGRTGTANYTTWFNERFPNTIEGAKNLLIQRISDKGCEKISHRPNTLPDLTGPLDDVDIGSHMQRYGDISQNFWERNVMIGNFEIKADNVQLNWVNVCCFEYTATVFVLEHTGADAPWQPGGECLGEDPLWFSGVFVSRDVRMAEWNVSGVKCCPSK